MRRLFQLCVLLFVAGSTLSCDRKAERHDAPQDQEQPAADGEQLPPLELRDDTAGVLLTWIDAEGEFHVVQKPADVPEEGRKQVRVVLRDKPAGTAQTIYVADLTQKDGNGRYSVRTMPRTEWDELGAARRKARLERIEPPVQPPTEGNAEAVIYGADWCKPCHQAEAYLRERKVPVVMKDIEEDPQARAEMRRKLASANLRDAQIPVIDIGGTLLVGFSPRSLDAALKKLSPPTATP